MFWGRCISERHSTPSNETKYDLLGNGYFLTLSVENFKTSPSPAIFYAVGFLKFTTMMIGIGFVIPRFLNITEVKKI